MRSMRFKLLAAYLTPIVVGYLRIFSTLVVFIWNPMSLPFRFLQVIPLVVICWSLFSYCELYTDGDPIVSLILSTIIHFLMIFGFLRVVVIIPFLPLLLLDIVYLVVKGFKATAFPFEIEGEEADEYLEFEDEM